MLKHVSVSCADVSRRSVRQVAGAEESGTGWGAGPASCCPSLSLTLPRPDRRAVVQDLSPDPVSPATNTIRVYANCLRPNLEYKTVVIQAGTTSKQVIGGLLTRFRMRHRDPKLFYLTMEVRPDKRLWYQGKE